MNNKNVMKENRIKINELSRKIMECNGNYHLICLDVDDVIFNIAPIMQQIFDKIDYRATSKYLEEILKDIPQDFEYGNKVSSIIRNAILEETNCVIENERGEKEHLDFSQPLIEYEKLYVEENLNPGAIEFVNSVLQNREPNTFVIFVSHRNPEREGVVKTEVLYNLFPEIDAVFTLPFHKQVGTNENNEKGEYLRTALQLENLKNCILVDNSKNNCKKWRKSGLLENPKIDELSDTKKDIRGIDIRYLPEGFSTQHALDDHLTKLASLDPYMFQFCLSAILYERENPGYLNDLKGNKVKKIDRK